MAEQVSWDELSHHITIDRKGYLYIYVSNETPNSKAYIDDLTITHTQSKILEITDFYPYGMVANRWERHFDAPNRKHYQGKELIEELGVYDFHARLYDPAIGIFLAVDPAGQFASPYVAMGNNPVMMIDPDGEVAFMAALAFIGKTALQGAAMNAGFYALSTTQDDVSWDWGDFGRAAATGAISGAFSGAGGLISNGLMGGVYGIVPGGLVQGGISGLAGGIGGALSNEIMGGSSRAGFWQGLRNGFIMGGIAGARRGFKNVADSPFERKILFGGGTKKGKIDYIKYRAAVNDVYNNGVRHIFFTSKGAPTTQPLLVGQPISLREAFEFEGGLTSNLNFNLSRSMRQIGSSFNHEFKHAKDIFYGIAHEIYLSTGMDLEKTIAYLEYRAYLANLEFGFRSSWYKNRVMVWDRAIDDIELFYRLSRGELGY